jgi:hypothetical protein
MNFLLSLFLKQYSVTTVYIFRSPKDDIKYIGEYVTDNVQLLCHFEKET